MTYRQIFSNINQMPKEHIIFLAEHISDITLHQQDDIRIRRRRSD